MGFSLYLTSLDPGLLDRQSESPPEFPHRSVGRPATETVCAGKGITIRWPQTEHGRVRRVISRSGVRRRYAVPCFRGQERDAHGEAAEEADAAILMDACAGVEFQEQPAEIEFEWRGAIHKHFPDSLVVAAKTKEFIEFKKDHEAADVVLRRRTDRLRELLQPLGFGYRMMSTRQLRRGAYLENAIAMRRHAKYMQMHCECQGEELANISIPRRTPASKLLGFLPADKRYGTLMSLLYAGVLSTDFSLPVNIDSHVHPPLSIDGGLPWVWELFESGS